MPASVEILIASRMEVPSRLTLASCPRAILLSRDPGPCSFGIQTARRFEVIVLHRRLKLAIQLKILELNRERYQPATYAASEFCRERHE